jgi:hypothetical protein
MGIIDFIQNRIDSSEGKSLGKFECTASTIGDMFLGLAHRVGLANPTKITQYSVKGVSIKKKKDKYIISLNMYKPPIEIEWSQFMPLEELNSMLIKIAEDNKRIGYINTKSLDNGQSYFQLALG